jgi:Alginate export
MKKLLVAVIVVLMASPAFAAIQNVKVSGDITSTWLGRSNFDLGLNGPDGTPVGLKKQNVFITQTRLRVDADLSDNVSTTVGLINERAWNAENTPTPNSSNPGAVSNVSNLDTNVQIYLASVTMRELLYSPLTVTIGRQEFNYGNGLIMGAGGVNNQSTGNLQFIAQDLTMRTTYDGVKAVLDYKPLTIDLFYFKNNQLLLNGSPISKKTSSDVYGINANYQLNDSMNTVVEGFLFTRFNGDNNQTAPGAALTTTHKGDTLFVPGLRASTNPIKGLNVQGNLAWQGGNHPVTLTNGSTSTGIQANERRSAMAAQVLASYSLPMWDKYKPTVNGSYTYVSGDKNGQGPFTSKDTAWDPFNENQGSGTIYNTLFPLSNLHIISAGASVNPLEDVTASATWSGLWSAKSFSDTNTLAIFQPDSGVALFSPATKNKNNALGNEMDLNLTYNYTEDVTFGVSVGWFIPGSAFASTNKNTASQALANVGVKF